MPPKRSSDEPTLFAPPTAFDPAAPLAARMRPRNLDEYVGQSHILGPGKLLRSAIENVLRNAVRYSPDGGCVEVDLQQDAQSVHIHVRDRGPGVPAQELQRIFEPFHRVAESRDRGSGGEGIGLAITAQVMQAHGGSATARIRDGGGLEVTLQLPRAAPASDGHPT